MPEIEINNLSVTYLLKNKDQIPAIRDFSCTFKNGKISGILGGSGSGKTTLLRALSLALTYDGDIYFDKKNILKEQKSSLGISYVSQEFVLYPHLTIYENLAFPLKNLKLSDEEVENRVLDVASLLKLTDTLTRLPKHLSIGQQQRVALGRALIKVPKLLLLDEPFSNLDKILSIELLNLIKEISEIKNMTVIFVSHELKDILSICDDLYLMEDGELKFSGNKNEFLASKDEDIKKIIKDSGVKNEKEIFE